MDLSGTSTGMAKWKRPNYTSTQMTSAPSKLSKKKDVYCHLLECRTGGDFCCCWKDWNKWRRQHKSLGIHYKWTIRNLKPKFQVLVKLKMLSKARLKMGQYQDIENLVHVADNVYGHALAQPLLSDVECWMLRSKIKIMRWMLQ